MAHTMSTGDCDSTVDHKDESAHNNLINISNMHELEMMSIVWSVVEMELGAVEFRN